ncbi:3-deoxy-D-manno-octulosonic-acid transferase [Burkholderiales bacterium GJ-E10]|nr:3-deoxy-D-manno-octulosonic-acid transferase [Burkholderiales bacterium GJ-E10]
MNAEGRTPQRAPAWYTAAWIAALPFVALYLCRRGLRQREYFRHWGERFLGAGALAPVAQAGTRGTTKPRGTTNLATIWIHAVSVGETHAAWPLIERLAQRHPDARFVLTHMTPTGRAVGAELAERLARTAGSAHASARILQRYLPYDLPGPVQRFLRETRPDVGVLMETEIWPTLLYEAAVAGIPTVLANARLSERSAAKAARFSRLFARAGANLAAVGAQTPTDRDRIARWFPGPIAVTGNLKFDLEPDAELVARGERWRARLGSGRPGGQPIWLFASTREGEEAMLLDALSSRARKEAAAPQPRLLFVPRHPQRFDDVAALLVQRGLRVLRRTQWDTPFADPAAPDASAVLLGDSMGEMPMYYAMADAAVIGGSLAPLGGQNLIEAAACGCPVVFGPHMFNFAQAAADAVASGAARRVADAAEALQALAEITGDTALHARMRAAAQTFSRTHRGAADRMVVMIEDALRKPPVQTATASGLP